MLASGSSYAAHVGVLIVLLLFTALLAPFLHDAAAPGSKHSLLTLLQARCQGSAGAGGCSYGMLPGHWVSSAPEGERWQVLDPSCRMSNRLREYATRRDGSLAPANILLLSDSTDRYLLQFLCDYLGGRRLTEFDSEDGLPEFNAYAFHICNSSSSMRLASAYFPGVHPSGPFHMGTRHNYTRRFATAARLWQRHFRAPPDLVVVSSLLWDIARLYSQDPLAVSRSELDPPLVHSWMANFSRVLHTAKQAFPDARDWAFHTTLPPRHSMASGLAEKPYLGHRYFVSQLNAAGRVVAQQQGLHVVDYYQVGNRFFDSQAYLVDLIHFGPQVALELCNIYLNLVVQRAGSAAAASGAEERQQQQHGHRDSGSVDGGLMQQPMGIKAAQSGHAGGQETPSFHAASTAADDATPAGSGGSAAATAAASDIARRLSSTTLPSQPA